MIRKSVETRDWLHTMEPRSVRSVMKRVVEEITLLDKQVATLYEEGIKKEQGSGEWLYTPFSPVSARGARCVSDNVSDCCLCHWLFTAEGGSRHTYSYSLTQGGKGNNPYSRYCASLTHALYMYPLHATTV